MEHIKKHKIGEFYWVFVDDGIMYESKKRFIFDEDEFNNLKYLKLSHLTHRLDDGIKYYFINPETSEKYSVVEKFIIINAWEMKYLVFPTIDLFLKNIVELSCSTIELNSHGYDFDDFMKNKIKESQERNPEIWI